MNALTPNSLYQMTQIEGFSLNRTLPSKGRIPPESMLTKMNDCQDLDIAELKTLLAESQIVLTFENSAKPIQTLANLVSTGAGTMFGIGIINGQRALQVLGGTIGGISLGANVVKKYEDTKLARSIETARLERLLNKIKFFKHQPTASKARDAFQATFNRIAQENQEHYSKKWF